MQDALKQALEHYQAGRMDAALACLNAMSQAARETEPVLALLGNLQAKAGELDEAGLTFLKLGAMPTATRANYARMAIKMLQAAGQGGVIGANALALLQAVDDDAGSCFAILSEGEMAGHVEAMADYVYRLDLSDPNQVFVGLRILRKAERHGDVISFLDRALAFRPDDGFFNAERFSQALKYCDFDVVDECVAEILDDQSKRGANMSAAEVMHRRLMWTDDPARMIKPALDKVMVERQTAGTPPPARRKIRPAGEKLRIAYLSNDYSSHATMTLLRQVLMDHDAERFEIGLFCYTPAQNAAQQADWPHVLREKIISVEALDDQAAASWISAWGADILVDLKGYTGGARPAIVKLSDAPVKVCWLGYPGSTPWIDLDYCITDPVVSPPGSERYFEEKLCYLPETYQPNDPVSRHLPQPQQRADHGLPNDAFVFTNFNGATKITRTMIGAWARLLNGVPGSVFWCLAPGEPVTTAIRAEFARNGILSDRLVFAEPLPYVRHIDRVPLADLAVDTFPYGGHTTTSDMLWAGLPVLALAGEGFASRVSSSLLTAIGAPELIAGNVDEFCRTGVELALDGEKLTAIRNRIAENRFSAPLFDSERFTRHLEKAFTMMACRARDGVKPDHIRVPALPARGGAFSVSR